MWKTKRRSHSCHVLECDNGGVGCLPHHQMLARLAKKRKRLMLVYHVCLCQNTRIKLIESHRTYKHALLYHHRRSHAHRGDTYTEGFWLYV